MPIINSTIFKSGITPTGTKNITNNGIVDVSSYANADVQVPTSAPTYYIEKINDNGVLKSGSTLINLTGITELPKYSLAYSYQNNTNITSIPDFSNVSIFRDSSLLYAFSGCANITGNVTLSNIAEVYSSGLSYTFSGSGITSITLDGNQTSFWYGAFRYICSNCTNLTTVNLPLMENLSNEMMSGAFSGCTALTSVNMDNLYKISNWGGPPFDYIFQNCSSLTSFSFTSLRTIEHTYTPFRYTFNRSAVTNVYFPALRDFASNYTAYFSNMLSGCSNVTVHFPSNLQSVIGSWSDVINGMGGTNTTILYDLPATLLITGTIDNTSYTFARNPKDDTSTALAWRTQTKVKGAISYYTSGTTDPQVGDTIYSDSACTIPVTTIDSIA